MMKKVILRTNAMNHPKSSGRLGLLRDICLVSRLGRFKTTSDGQSLCTPRGEGQGIKISVESKASDIPSELHLLGLRVDEAINMLDGYINAPLLANLNTIKIVNRKGTGALKKL